MIEDLPMTRARLYVLISAFESDLRQVAITYLLDHLDDQEALGPNYAGAELKRQQDRTGEDEPITSYLDLRELYDILNRHRREFPVELVEELRSNTAEMDVITPIRNRVMHARPLKIGDPENAVSSVNKFTTRHWRRTQEIVRKLISDPDWEPTYVPEESYSDKILNNLPRSEYDETGLVGRATVCKEIIEHLVRRRDSIITITGEGGIGKTAVAVEVASALLDNPKSPYECILWVSLKTERLTARGVESISDAIRDLTGATRQLGQTLDHDFSGELSELAEVLEGIPTLIVIDNLETVSGEEVIELYDTLPPSVTYLLTSRVGLGQFERRINLGPLETKDASFLFRKFAASRGMTKFARSSQSFTEEMVARLRNSPLAIRWYLLAVEAGNPPEKVLTDQAELVEFCVRSVYDSLKPEAQTLLLVLHSLSRSVSFDQLAILVDASIDSLRGAVQYLSRGSMVVWEVNSDDGVSSEIRLTEAAQQFLRRVRPANPELIEKLVEKERKFRHAEEHRRADEKRRQLGSNVVRTRSDRDQPAAHLLRLALQDSWDGLLDSAYERISRARQLDSEYWEVDRVEALVRSTAGQTEQASALYRSALRLVETDEERAAVNYYFAGHLARRARDLDKALEHAQGAHSIFQGADTAQLLGNIHVWLNQFDRGQELLEFALDKSNGRMRLIVLTSLVTSWCRWSNYLLEEEHRPVEAIEKAYSGFNNGIPEIKSGTIDRKLSSAVVDCCQMVISVYCLHANSQRKKVKELRSVVKFLFDYKDFLQGSKHWSYMSGYIGKIIRCSWVDEKTKEIARSLGDTEAEQGLDGEDVKTGVIINWKPGSYGFISHPDFPGNLYFHKSAFDEYPRSLDGKDLNGARVEFTAPQSGNVDKPRANWVRLLES